jgi:YbbR domain-containing protein
VKILQWLRDHVGLQLVSVAIATLLWVVVSGEVTVEREIRAPLEFTNIPASLEIVGEPPTTVDVRIRGSSGILNRVAAADLATIVDVSGARPGQRLFQLAQSSVRAPFGVDVVQVSPATVAVAFEETGTRMLPVTPAVVGKPADGYVVARVTSNPAVVEVVGPAGILASLTSATTEPISVAGARATRTELVVVGLPGSRARVKTPMLVQATAVVEPAPVEWTVSVPVRVVGARGAVAVSPDRVSLRVRGRNGSPVTEAARFSATVDASGRKGGQFEGVVTPGAPSGIDVLRIEPAEVRVRIR